MRLCISSSFIEGLREFGVSEATIQAALRRNAKVHGPNGNCDCRYDPEVELAEGWESRPRRRLRRDANVRTPCIHGPGDIYECGHPDCVGARV